MLIEYLPFYSLVVVFVLFPLTVRSGFRFSSAEAKSKILAAVNLAGLLCLCYLSLCKDGSRSAAVQYGIATFAFTGLYLLFVLLHFLVLSRSAKAPENAWLTWNSFLVPIGFLAFVKYLPSGWSPLHAFAGRIGTKSGVELLLGVSYMAFRLSYLTLEVRNESVKKPGLWEYLGFAFFLPTLAVGPINTYEVHAASLAKPSMGPVGPPLLRILKGLVKYLFLASIVNQLSYSGLLLDGNPHPTVDLLIAALAFYLFLYLNFSGYCDMAIGAAALVGIEVKENFNSPFLARNIKDFWNRWHITLSTYTRDVIFSPLSKWLISKWGMANANHAIAVSILTVFLVIGVWHGVGWNYLLFGGVHGLGLIANHYYTVFLKNQLGRDRFIAYTKSKLIHVFSVILTFIFTGASLFLFANDFAMARKIFFLIGG